MAEDVGVNADMEFYCGACSKMYDTAHEAEDCCMDITGLCKKPESGSMKTIQPKPAYYGITHPDGPDAGTWNECRNGCHLFDEVLNGNQHYLICDACGLEIHISKIVSH
jgi:hypothetical protein